jgi:catalase
MYIPLNPAAYTPNTLNAGSPKQANQTVGNGFFSAPGRTTSGKLTRAVSPTFADVWSQPRLFYNSLTPAEQQFVVNAMRFETANLKSSVVKQNVIIQLNRVSNDVAKRVAEAIGVEAPEPDPTFYHDNKTAGVGVFGSPLLKTDGLKVGFLTSVSALEDQKEVLDQLKSSFSKSGVDIVVVAESLSDDAIGMTYSTADAIGFDSIIVGDGTEPLFTKPSSNSTVPASSTLYPAGRPLQILVDGYRYGKPIAALAGGAEAFKPAYISESSKGVYVSAKDKGDELADAVIEGLKTFKFLDRFAIDQ